MAPKQRPGLSKQTYGTPDEFLIAVRRRLGIDAFAWDLAATRGVNECSPFGCYTVEDDALAGELNRWLFPGWCWLNPEFADISPWVERSYEVGRIGGRVAVLVPASVGANWWSEWVEHKCTAIPLNGRITFVGETDPYPKDCALLLYGPEVLIGYDSAWRWMDTLTEEELEMAKRRVGKPGKKKPKDGVFINPTKGAKKTPKVRQMRRGGSRAAAEKSKDSGNSDGGARVTTFKPNGSDSRVVLPEPAVVDNGPILLPDPESAQKVLGELAQMNDRALEAKARYETFKEATKHAKEKYDELAEMVLTRLRQSTHKSDLPLFADVDKREEDQRQMEALTEPPAAPMMADDSEFPF